MTHGLVRRVKPIWGAELGKTSRSARPTSEAGRNTVQSDNFTSVSARALK